MSIQQLFRKDTTPFFIFTFVLGVFFAIAASVWATSIGTNLSVSGTLTSTGNATMSSALTTTGVATFSGIVNASSTLAVTGVSNLYGNVFYNGFATTTASNGNFDTQGRLMASTTLVVTGVSNQYGNVNVNGFATTTASNGNFNTNGVIGIASTTVAKQLDITGDALLNSSGTTTLTLDTTGTNQAGCIQLRTNSGKSVRVFVNNSSFALVAEQGGCK